MSYKIKLLIVDDEIVFLKTIKKRLELRGFEVTAVSNGDDALNETKINKFDIALLDLKMPGLDGMAVLKILNKEHPNIEVIILTAHGSINAAVEASKLGCFGFLTKPYDFNQLIDMIRDAYEARLKMKFEKDEDKSKELMDKIAELPFGTEDPLAMLDELRKLEY